MQRTLFRLRIVGIAVAMAGLALAAAGLAYGLPTADAGLDSAQAMYRDQGVSLSYNDDGHLVDRGTEEGANAILALLEDDWAYPVDEASFDPDDPLVNTRDELMYQYAVIVYHVWHGTAAVTLTDDDLPITYRGVTYTSNGTYDIQVGGYYAEFDRTHPIEGQLRAAWSPLALSLTSYLAAGHANQAAGELAWAVSLATSAIGGVFVLAGLGLVWASVPPRRKSAPADPELSEAYQRHQGHL